jgi:SAM-dependent methyltransferase
VTRLFAGHDRLHHLPGQFWVVRCVACGVTQTSPRPSGDALAAYYPEDYGPHRDASEEPGGNEEGAARRSRLRRWLKQRLGSRRIWWTPDLPSGARVLELGSGAGHFVRHALARGWEVHAIEPAGEPAARLARDLRIRVHRESAEAIDVPAGSFDAAFAWMVVEHLENPLTVLRKIAVALRPGGYFVFSVPNAASWEFAVFRSRWYALQVPTHLWHFTPRTLRRLLSECGFTAERVFHQKVLKNITGSLAYVGEDHPAFAPLARRLALMLTPAWISFGVGAVLAAVRQGGRLTVVARAARRH